MRLLRAAAAYFAIVFSGGFVLGALRTTWLAPKIGDFRAVACELPLMLALSAWAAGLVVRRLAPEAGLAGLAAIGALAFLLLQAAELGLAVAVLGGSPDSYAAKLGEPAGVLGLAGQLMFAALPMTVRRRAA